MLGGAIYSTGDIYTRKTDRRPHSRGGVGRVVQLHTMARTSLLPKLLPPAGSWFHDYNHSDRQRVGEAFNDCFSAGSSCSDHCLVVYVSLKTCTQCNLQFFHTMNFFERLFFCCTFQINPIFHFVLRHLAEKRNHLFLVQEFGN